MAKSEKVANCEQCCNENETKNFEDSLEKKKWFTEYGSQRYARQCPLYKSTYMEHGWFPPNKHTTPLSYHPSRRSFTKHLIESGMYRNTSLNTGMDPKPWGQ